MQLLCVCLIVCTVLGAATGHGWLERPPGRSSAWRYGFPTPVNYNDNELNCGGYDDHYNGFGGKCGLCGDRYGGPRSHEPGPDNVYAAGVIVANYTQGQAIAVKIKLTAPHKGYHEFRLCKNDVPQLGLKSSTAAQCVPASPAFPMLQSPDGRTKFDEQDPAIVLKLPADITCEACILQWRWRTGNRWGCDAEGCGLGYGNQEEFYGCADVRIVAGAVAGQGDKIKVSSGTPRPATLPTTTISTVVAGPAAGAKTTPAAAIPKATSTDAGAAQRKLLCQAVAPYGADVARWCNVVCNAAQPSCPATHCRCTA